LLEIPVTVYPNPKAGFSYGPYGDELTISDPEVQFTNLSTELGGNTYQWKIDNLYTVTDVNPTITFPKIGRYEITLTATSIYGCHDKVSQTLEIKNDFGVYIPNSFTPNEDGVNDVFGPVFTPYGLDAKTFEMEIFNRWGASLYRSKDVTKGWNGTIQNKGAEPLKEEVYVYKIKYKDMNGVVYNKLGYVTLLR
jgi:gliding motility-associated-like protein